MARRALPLLLAVGLLAACGGGGGDGGQATTLPTLPPSVAATTAAPPTTAAGTTVEPATTTPTTVASPPWPLTGLPGADQPRAQLPAVVVKVDNHPQARPQAGLGQADVVVEEIVEGITRFFAVFHSTTADPVGPIRSARTTDIPLLPMFGRPLFAWSGGNKGVTNALKSADVAVDLGASTGGNYRQAGYYREAGRRAPHNLFATTTNLWALTPADSSPPPAVFRYGPAGTPPAGAVPVAGAKLTMAATRVLWRWDPARNAWLRTQDDKAHTDSTGAQLATENVVVLEVPYRRSPADPISPEAVTVGEGRAWVLAGGAAVEGRWQRGSADEPFRLLDGAGRDILLTPGRTWVELPREGGTVLVPAGADPTTIPYPR